MLDNLKFDRAKYPSTGYVANLLCTTELGFRWSLEFFSWARDAVDADRATERDCFGEFKKLGEDLAHKGIFSVKIETVDWVALLNFMEEKTRPSEPKPWQSSTILRAPSNP